LLLTHLDLSWRYVDGRIPIDPDAGRYAASEQVADLAAVVFHEFVSLSIQHLVNEIGKRMFTRYPALTEISFEAQNRTFDMVEVSSADDGRKVYTDPRPPYGRIGLTMSRG
jgi:urate oxidase